MENKNQLLAFSSLRMMPQDERLKLQVEHYLNTTDYLVDEMISTLKNLKKIRKKLKTLSEQKDKFSNFDYNNTLCIFVNMYSRDYRKFSGTKSDADKNRRELISLVSPNNTYYSGDLKIQGGKRGRPKGSVKKQYIQYSFVKDEDGYVVAIPENTTQIDSTRRSNENGTLISVQENNATESNYTPRKKKSKMPKTVDIKPVLNSSKELTGDEYFNRNK